jgi:DNA-binding NarL/FixJ family response regulator
MYYSVNLFHDIYSAAGADAQRPSRCFMAARSRKAAGLQRPDLSPREREVTELRRDGLTQREVADHLGVSIKTVAAQSALASRKLKGQAQLTPREVEVGKLLALGKSSTDIAEGLGIARNTVMEHRRRLMSTLGLHTVVELTHYAIVEGWVQAGEAVEHYRDHAGD